MIIFQIRSIEFILQSLENKNKTVERKTELPFHSNFEMTQEMKSKLKLVFSPIRS